MDKVKKLLGKEIVKRVKQIRELDDRFDTLLNCEIRYDQMLNYGMDALDWKLEAGMETQFYCWYVKHVNPDLDEESILKIFKERLRDIYLAARELRKDIELWQGQKDNAWMEFHKLLEDGNTYLDDTDGKLLLFECKMDTLWQRDKEILWEVFNVANTK